MNNNNRFLIIGGDNRQLYMADYLKANGFDVATYGLSENTVRKSILKGEIINSRYIILPLPLTKDGTYIHTADSTKITVDEVISYLNENHIVFGGMINKTTEIKMKKKTEKVFDYFKREDITVRNTVPTVQGILKVIFDNINYTLNSSTCAVFGYGKVGTLTADTLNLLGGDVTVVARKYSDLAKAEIRGLKSCLIKDFKRSADLFQIIINTVPSPIIGTEILKELQHDCLIIDVASAPYGVDFAAADKYGINAILCPSLPGKVAPVTAGKIIADGILNIIEEEGYE